MPINNLTPYKQRTLNPNQPVHVRTNKQGTYDILQNNKIIAHADTIHLYDVTFLKDSIRGKLATNKSPCTLKVRFPDTKQKYVLTGSHRISHAFNARLDHRGCCIGEFYTTV